MLDFLCVYSIVAIAWAYFVEVKKGTGFWAKAGFIAYFPFVALVLLVNKEYKI